MPAIVENETAKTLMRYHPFLSFAMYCIGFCGFVLSLQPGYYKFQFKQFGWTHLALVLIVMQCSIITQNL